MNTQDQNQQPKVQINQASPTEGQVQDSLDKDIYKTEAKLDQLNKLKQFREAARPLMEYLEQNYNPHFKVLVDSHSVELFDAHLRINR